MAEGLITCGCGGKPSIWQHKNDQPYHDGFWVECAVCCHQTTTHPTDLTAAAAWNIAMRGLLSDRLTIYGALEAAAKRFELLAAKLGDVEINGVRPSVGANEARNALGVRLTSPPKAPA